MTGILSNAVSGLQASQTALRTSGHNISNANTAGYSRQEVNTVTRPEQRIGSAGFIGSGVSVSSIERVVNEFVSTQLRSDTSAYNQLNAFDTNIGKIDKLFSDANTGLSGGLQTFFKSIQNSADEPSSIPARQLLVTESDSLSKRFNNLYSRLDELSKGVKNEVVNVVGQVKSLAQSIANLNQSIGEKGTSGEGGAANDLLDQRDEALRKLSELISVQLVKDESGNVNAFVGNGEPLVVGPNVSGFRVTNDGKVFFDSDKTSFDITAQLKGGKLGGLLDFKERMLAPSMNELGRIAIVMADQFNRLQHQGLDLDGEFGGNMFAELNTDTIAADRVVHGDNSPPYDRLISVTIEDTSKITASDYEFKIVPGSSNYTITRLSDNKLVVQGALSGAYPSDIEFDGIKLTLTNGTFTGGDTFRLQPTKNGARDMKSEMSRPEDFAFAVPIRTLSASENSGSGAISSGSVLSLTDANKNPLPLFSQSGKLSPPIVVRFTSETTYDILDNTDPANPKNLVPAIREQIFTPGIENELFTSDIGETKILGRGARIGLPDGSLAADVGVISSTAAQSNGYPAERYSFTYKDPVTGSVSDKTLITQSGSSAAQTASLLSSLPGVSANAFTRATITDINIAPAAFAYPLQISLNGENLIQHVDLALSVDVPDPNLDEVAFNDYLANRINANTNLQSLGVRATSGHNALTGAPEVQIVASSGVNLDFRFSAEKEVVGSIPASNISINDGQNSDVRLTGVNDSATLVNELSAITVGGRIDLTLAAGISMATSPSESQLFGDSRAEGFAQSSFLGIQASIKGKPKAGDVFTINFNTDATNDNRNAIAFARLESLKTIDSGGLSFEEGYGKLVQSIGTTSSLSKINTEASRSLLTQTQAFRDAFSGVNLDEEAADLIKFQQLYQANARVISVARELFDTLLQSL